MPTARKYSRKRDAILQCVRSTTCHPTADWVYRQLKPEIPDLSLGTVYRNLAAFKEDGVIISVGTVDGFEHFDGRTDPHSHLVCTCCGSVTDLEGVDLPAALVLQARERSGGQVTGYRLSFYGYCKICKTNNL